MVEFAWDQRWKLYRDGRIFEIAVDLDERRPVDPAAVPADGRPASQKLTAALAQFEGARASELDALPSAPRESSG
ncbi:MAG: hypothetical protein N2652_03475 [Kiritimatiellae bacterium]|nr:hypothetical protein [Kiritimatiellia bacterium]